MDLPGVVMADLLAGLHLPQGHHVPQDQGAGPHHLPVRGLLRRLAEADHQLGGQGFLQGLCGKWCHVSPYSAGSSFPAVPFLGVVCFLAGVFLPVLAAVFFAAGFLAAVFLAAVRFPAAGFFSGASAGASAGAGSRAGACAGAAASAGTLRALAPVTLPPARPPPQRGGSAAAGAASSAGTDSSAGTGSSVGAASFAGAGSLPAARAGR